MKYNLDQFEWFPTSKVLVTSYHKLFCDAYGHALDPNAILPRVFQINGKQHTFTFIYEKDENRRKKLGKLWKIDDRRLLAKYQDIEVWYYPKDEFYFMIEAKEHLADIELDYFKGPTSAQQVLGRIRS